MGTMAPFHPAVRHLGTIPNRWSKAAVRPILRGPVTTTVDADPLARFSPPVREWFRASFAAPTEAQADGWAAISEGRHTLIHAPTGSGKTLAAFLWCLDRLARDPSPPAVKG